MSRSPYAQGEQPPRGLWEFDRYYFTVQTAFSPRYGIVAEGYPEPMAFLDYSLLSIRNHLRVVAADEAQTLLLELRGTNFANDWAKLLVSDPTRREVLGDLSRHFWSSLNCDTWTVRGPQLQPLAAAREDQTGPLRHLASGHREYSFFVHGRIAGKLRLTSFSKGWELDLTADSGKELDRRLAMALAAVLMTIELFS